MLKRAANQQFKGNFLYFINNSQSLKGILQVLNATNQLPDLENTKKKKKKKNQFNTIQIII